MIVLGAFGSRADMLQWVHGRITVVMNIAEAIRAAVLESFNGSTVGQLVVMEQILDIDRPSKSTASMGPRSDNRGYDQNAYINVLAPLKIVLQWVHGRITVVMRDRSKTRRRRVHRRACFNGSTVG